MPVTPIEQLPNLGPRSAVWLRAAGLESVEQVRQLGPELAFQIVRQHNPRVTLNLLWALAAGLAERDWRTLTADEKRELQRRCAALDHTSEEAGS